MVVRGGEHSGCPWGPGDVRETIGLGGNWIGGAGKENQAPRKPPAILWGRGLSIA